VVCVLPCSDRFGRKHVYLAATFAFIATSLVSWQQQQQQQQQQGVGLQQRLSQLEVNTCCSLAS
jgi:hypothetical protein